MLKNIILFTTNLLFFTNVLAKPYFTKVSVIPEFIDGLNIDQIEKCENYYEKKCSLFQTKNIVEEISKENQCIEKKMAQKKACKQALAIRHITYYQAFEMRRYSNKIVVFSTRSLADAQDTFYIVDKKGELIELTVNDALVNKNPNYITLKKKYPNLALTSFIYWKNEFVNLQPDIFPELYSSINSSFQNLVFKQELRDNFCVACKPVAIAYIAYQFNSNSQFINPKLLKIDILPESFSR